MSTWSRYCKFDAQTFVLLSCIAGLVAACGSNAGSNCARAASYLRSCGVTAYVSCDPSSPSTPDQECEAACDLETSCAYFLGQSPAEGRPRAQCGSRCTCESAKRRATECGVVSDFECSQVCNCPYLYTCTDGIPGYITCRTECPPWPEPTDAGDSLDAAAK
jgi:hypothetical protein